MQEIDIHLDMPVPEEQFAAVVERMTDHFKLYVRMKDTLRAYPGCLHWHLGMRGERGTLELTYWPDGKRAWLAVQAGRRAAWIEGLLPRAKEMLEAEVGGMF